MFRPVCVMPPHCTYKPLNVSCYYRNKPRIDINIPYVTVGTTFQEFKHAHWLSHSVCHVAIFVTRTVSVDYSSQQVLR